MTPLQNARHAPQGAPRPAARDLTDWAACEPSDRRLADRLQRRVRRLPCARQRRPIARSLTRGFGELVEGSKSPANVAAAAFGLNLRDQSPRVVARRLVEIAHPHKIVEVREEAIGHAACLSLRRSRQHVRRNCAERCSQSAIRRRPVRHRLQRRERCCIDAEAR